MSTDEYTLRSLTTIEEINQWSEFCAECFSYKANPPPASYFLRHFRNDPHGQLAHVFVALCNVHKCIVASVRLFVRDLNDGRGGVIRAGGIGEVCTSSSHRKKGLSHKLLHMALNSDVVRKLDLKVSLLHASETFRPVYAKLGYVSVRTRWVKIKGNFDSLPEINTERFVFREASFPKDIDAMSRIYTSMNSKRFGCVVRSQEYWEKYVAPEMYLAAGCTKPMVLSDLQNNDNPIAWLSLRILPEEYVVKDFGYDTNNELISIRDAFMYLIGNVCGFLEEKNQCCRLVCVKTPGFVFNQMEKTDFNIKDETYKKKLESVSFDDDLGWMYKCIDDGNIHSHSFTKQLNQLPDDESIDGESCSHFVWPTDSF